MAVSDNDPRVFFAAERTLLAWLRTGLAVIAIGFMVSRFGLFLKLIRVQSAGNVSAPQNALSAWLGVLFVTLGSLSIGASAFQHLRFVRTLPLADLPASYSRRFAVGLSLAVALLGLGLAYYLTLS